MLGSKGPGWERHGERRVKRRGESQEREKLVYGHFGTANQRSQRPCGEFLVLRNREVGPRIRFGHYNVAAYPAHDPPARLGEGLDSFFAGNVGEPCHPITRRRKSNGYDDGGAVGTHSLDGFLILGP